MKPFWIVLFMSGPISLFAQSDFAPSLITYVQKSTTVRDIATDCQGNLYITGGVTAQSLVSTENTYDPSYNTGGEKECDAYVTKMDKEGNILWSTYFGGPNYDRAYAIEVDQNGDIIIAGRAGAGLPTTVCAIQTDFAGDNNPNSRYGEQDGFIAKISSDGTELKWSTYFGGAGRGIIRDIDIDDLGNVYLGMTQVESTIPHITEGAFQTTPQGGFDGVVAKLSSEGSIVEYATYIGGSLNDFQGPSVRVDSEGNLYALGGWCLSTDMPFTENAYDKTHNGNGDYFLVKLSPEGNLLFGTYLGGSDGDGTETHNLELDNNENPIIAGQCLSSDFPTTDGAFQETYSGTGGPGSGQQTNYPGDGHVSVISKDGSSLLHSTFIGGSEGDAVEGIGFTANNEILVTGGTYSTDFPVTDDGTQQNLGGTVDQFVTVFSLDLSEVVFSTFIGGSGDDMGRSAHADQIGNVYAAGTSLSSDLQVVGTSSSNPSGEAYGLVVKMDAQTPLENPVCADSEWTDPCSPIITSLDSDPKVTVYPNPTNGQLTVESVSLKDEIVSVFDLLGKSHRVELIDNEIDLRELNDGVYILRVSTITNHFVIKVIVRKN